MKEVGDIFFHRHSYGESFGYNFFPINCVVESNQISFNLAIWFQFVDYYLIRHFVWYVSDREVNVRYIREERPEIDGIVVIQLCRQETSGLKCSKFEKNDILGDFQKISKTSTFMPYA